MTTQPYRNDDDDLFDYDPSKEQTSNYSQDYLTSSTQNNNSKDNSLLDDIYRQMDNLVHSDGEEAVNEFRIRLSDSLNEAYSQYLSKSSVVSHVQAVTITLDEVTNGRFSELYLLKNLEQNIFRRINIHFLLNAIIDDGGENNISFKDFLAKVNISISDDFIPVYFLTLLNISSHTLDLERAMYMDLSQRLGITPNPLAIHSDPTPKEISNAVPLTASQFRDSIYNSVYEKISSTQEYTDSINNIFVADSVIKISKI